MSKNSKLQRIILIVWDWDKGIDPVGAAGSDEWFAHGISDLLVRVDKEYSPESIDYLARLAAQYLQNGQLLILLHNSSHAYRADSRQEIFEKLRGHDYLHHLKILLFGGGRTPIYNDGVNKGFLGSDGNFSRELQNAASGEKTETKVIHTPKERLLYPEPFSHVWGHYWVSTRHKVYSLMENFRLWTDAFDFAEYDRFIQYLRQESGMLWPQLVHFTQNKREIEKLPKSLKSELLDFSFCEKQVELIHGRDRSLKYKNARETVGNLLTKPLKSAKDAEDARDTIYNELDELQNALPEALNYDSLALFSY
ncbi:MAG: hypothetical protein H7246_02420 [Phycisphaerae bacterium]|nr:hypothetical protein [Saprospiraceae bacterium]